MRAFEVAYLLGERFSNAMLDLGVPKPLVEEWHRLWGQRVLDVINNEGSPSDVCAQIVNGIRSSRDLVEMCCGH